MDSEKAELVRLKAVFGEGFNALDQRSKEIFDHLYAALQYICENGYVYDEGDSTLCITDDDSIKMPGFYQIDLKFSFHPRGQEQGVDTIVISLPCDDTCRIFVRDEMLEGFEEDVSFDIPPHRNASTVAMVIITKIKEDFGHELSGFLKSALSRFRHETGYSPA